MEIVYKTTDELIPYENNPRNNNNAVNAVAASIEKFGFKVPIVIDESGVIIAGHTRLQAANKLGMKEVPCIVADDLSEQQIKAFRLADNKTAELAEWDLELLASELEDIEYDMTMFGFELEGENFNFEVPDKNESEFKETAAKTVTCPNCGLQFEPIEE